MRHDGLCLDDAPSAIRELRAFMAVTTEEDYLADRLKQSFVFHRLVILGEGPLGGFGLPSKPNTRQSRGHG